jgi:DNA-binding beta-propeller fold protein YncE
MRGMSVAESASDNNEFFSTRLSAKDIYADQPQPWEAYLYDMRHIRAKNVRGDEFVVPYFEQYGDSFENAADRISRSLYRDGVQGIGHATPYITGAVLPDGRLAFVETSPRGRVGTIDLDGTVSTICGWRLIDGVVPYNPNDFSIPQSLVATQYEHVGDADIPLNMPTDICIDPQDPTKWYIADVENARIALLDTTLGMLSTYAGVYGVEGYRDGDKSQALFFYPTSIAITPDGTMYVCDRGNHALRSISPSGVVTTAIATNPLAGGVSRPANGKFNSYNRTVTRTWRVDGSTNIANLLYPLCIRANSRGQVLIAEPWYSSIRVYDPLASTVKTLMDFNDAREWQWIDVDTQGTFGPVDDIFIAHMLNNVTRVYSDGSGAQDIMSSGFFFPCPANMHSAPHYPWLVAVGQGSLWTSGFGSMGISRLRKRTAADHPYVAAEFTRYAIGRSVWLRGDTTSAPGVSDLPGLDLLYGRFGVNGLLDLPPGVLTSKVDCATWLQGLIAPSANPEDVRFFLCKHYAVPFI